jgi:hypothetical protein
MNTRYSLGASIYLLLISLRITTQSMLLPRRIPVASYSSVACRICASSGRQSWYTTRSIHHLRTASSHNRMPVTHQPAQRFRFASSATGTTTRSGPEITIPDFPTHANRPASAAGGLSKRQVQGTIPSLDELKADEEWGEDTELVPQEEAKIFVTDPAIKVPYPRSCSSRPSSLSS